MSKAQHVKLKAVVGGGEGTQGRSWTKRKWARLLGASAGFCCALQGATQLLAQAATNLVVAPPPPALETNAAVADMLRPIIQLQEQLYATRLAIERNRLEAEAAAARNAEVIAGRLQLMEQSLASQRGRELETMQSANRLMLIVAGVCAGVGFVAMLLTAYLQWRAVGRLTEFSLLSQASLTLRRSALPSPGTAHVPLSAESPEPSDERLFNAMERLERRIIELEHTAQPALPAAAIPVGATKPSATQSGATSAPVASAPPDHSPARRVTVLMAKGQSLFQLEKFEQALACFDDVLRLQPNHAEALVKKGDALEQLRRVDDAIQCYDRAIAADESLTVAYLHKGGLFNRLERHAEALQCYEQALRTQDGSRRDGKAVEALSS